MWTITLILLILLTCIWLLWREKHLSVLKDLNIPGPEPNLFFGNLLEMIYKNPVQCIGEWITNHGKVFGYYAGLTPIIVIADLKFLKRIQVSEFHKFINRPTLPFHDKSKPRSTQLVDLRDKRWKEIRSILTPSFTTSKLRAMIPIINGCIDTHLGIIEEKCRKEKSFDISEKLRLLSMDIIGGTSFGIETNFQKNPDDPFFKAIKTVMSLFSGEYSNFFNILPYAFPELSVLWRKMMMMSLALRYRSMNVLMKLRITVKGIIESRKNSDKERRQDLLQLMIDARIDESHMHNATVKDLTASEKIDKDEEEIPVRNDKLTKFMTDQDICSNSMLFFMAGFETMSTAMSFTIHFLVHYPDIQQKIRDEIDTVTSKNEILDYTTVQKLQYLDQVFREATRYYPPITSFVQREVNEDMDLDGLKLKKGLTIMVPVYNIHHDPDFWTDPDDFLPDRFSPEKKESIEPIAYQAFGAGPRNCIGMRFALIASKLCLARIIQRYKLEACKETDELGCKLKFQVHTISPAKGVFVKAVKI